MRARAVAARQPEHGMTTAEYATGCVGTASVATALVQLVGSGYVSDLFRRVFDTAFSTPLPDLFGTLW